MIAFADGAPGNEPAQRLPGVRVNSRAELVEHLKAVPKQLRPVRMPRPPRAGHPDFIGPVQPEAINRDGALRFNGDGSPYFIVKKESWEESRDLVLLALIGDL